ncbi:MAG: hypothetical protein R6U44_06830 [Archaeoglobaceae archaeon]
MLNDKNNKILVFFTALIILGSIIVYSIAIDQNSIEAGDAPQSLNNTNTTPTSTPGSKSASTTPSLQEQIPEEPGQNDEERVQVQTPEQQELSFSVYVSKNNIEECGMTCRKIPATLENTGGETAHNVMVTVEIYCNGERIDVNGEDYLSLDLGTLEPGESETRTEQIDVGFGGGLCIRNNGAKIVFTVTSDEKTMTLEETYDP